MTTDFNNVLKRKKLNIKDVLDEKALKELIVRVTNKQQYADKFEFIKVESAADFYSIYDKDNRIVIEATNGVSAAAGINYYLTEICHAYFGPITQNINLDDVPPSVGKKHTQTSVFIYRYFMNYCTYSYTMLYAGWEEYERLTDWMLLNGVNLVLNIVGHEIVMRDMLMDVGYTQEEAVNYITGPAYLPWQMMGNMSEFGGNLPSWWFEKQKLLGNRINQKLTNFGVGIIMPGFYGLVPPDLNEKYPDANVIKQGVWCDAFESPAIVSDKDPMFDTFSESFYRNTKKHFGNIRYFSGDPFHESGCKDGIVVNEYGKKIVSSMKEHNTDGVWFLQGWQENPTFELIKDINKEDLLIGFLSADRFYANQKGFYGYPWMYISTPNFGGNRVMNGNIKGFMTEPFDIIKNHPEQLLVGNGMAMEGIELDEIIYDAFGYMNFKKECPDVDEFAKIDTDARYGTNNAEMKKAYKQMIDKVYVLTDELLYSGNESVLCARPDIDAQCVTYWGAVPEGYSLELLNDLVDRYLSQYETLKDNECYRLEFLDLSRQLIAEKGRESLKKIRDNFTNHQYAEYKEEQERFFELIDLDEELLSTNDKTNINNWVKRAEDYAEDEKDKAMLVFNAKNILMLWASVEGSSLLHDYAYREWCGIMQHYKNRWKLYFEKLDGCFDSGEKPNIDFTQMDLEFANSTYVCINSDKELNELVKASIAI